MNKDLLYIVDLNTVELTETNGTDSSWVHALPIGDYTHPVFGPLKYTADKIRAYAEGIKAKIRGIDPSINIMHGSNSGDGEAAGWVKDAEARPDGLWVFVEWTKDAAQKIRDKAWRYFSAEYQDKWKDPTGKEHSDVFIGGALTNRPYMKNLLPINLSENSIDTTLELAEIVTSMRAAQNAPKEEDVDLKKFVELLGLPEGTTEEQLIAKFAEIGKTTPAPEPKPTPTVPKVNLSEELRKLSEDNPMVKALLDTIDEQNKSLAEHHLALREADVERRLSEFDNSKIVLTPVAKDLVHDFAMDLPIAMTERFWEIMEKMRSSSSLMVELGERAGTAVRYGRAKDPVSQFMDQANALAQGEKISLTEAMEKVAAENPKLYTEYRNANYSFRD